MKKLFFILTFAFFLSFDAFASECSDIKASPDVSLQYSFGKLSYNNSLNIPQITALAKEIKQTESAFFVEGLATADINFKINITTSTNPGKFNKYCVAPDKADIFLGINNPTIYLANSLKEGSCKYNIVLRHERTHQQINKTTLEYYLPIFKAAATNIIKNIPVVSINDLSQIEPVTKELTEKINAKLLILVNFIKKELTKEQLKLDNKENYQYEVLLCKDTP